MRRATERVYTFSPNIIWAVLTLLSAPGNAFDPLPTGQSALGSCGSTIRKIEQDWTFEQDAPFLPQLWQYTDQSNPFRLSRRRAWINVIQLGGGLPIWVLQGFFSTSGSLHNCSDIVWWPLCLGESNIYAEAAWWWSLVSYEQFRDWVFWIEGNGVYRARI